MQTKEKNFKLNKIIKNPEILISVERAFLLKDKKIKNFDAIFAPYCHIKKLTKLYEYLTGFT